jgi:hypothetical protein
MVPDVFKNDAFGLHYKQIQELAIFLLGMTGFLFFIAKDRQLSIHHKEKKREQRRLQQTANDLVESYSYIGEINRKMDMLMQIGLGLSARSTLNKKQETEIYQSIIESVTALLKARCSTIRFVHAATGKIVKDVVFNEKCRSLKNGADFFDMEDNVYIKNIEDFMIFRSEKTMNGVKSYLIIKSPDKFLSENNNNQEIIKYLIAQSLFLYSYLAKSSIYQKNKQ